MKFSIFHLEIHPIIWKKNSKYEKSHFKKNQNLDMTWFDPKFHWTFRYQVIRTLQCTCSICLYYVKLIFFFNTKIWSICWENRKCSKYIQRVEMLHSTGCILWYMHFHQYVCLADKMNIRWWFWKRADLTWGD